ncbi:MAG: hypothetical protein WEB37_00745 [Bacteroidota bacterium]
MNRFMQYSLVLVLAGTIVPYRVQPDGSAPDRTVRPVPQFLHKGLAWLAAAQFENGGWGAGSHSNQSIRDPRAVQIDPATTAFSAMALMRAGSTVYDGPYSKNISRALFYLLEMAEASPEEGANITSLTGTQPQAKMGQNVDVTMCSQFFSRILPQTSRDAKLKKRVREALNKCLRKIERGQNKDGSWAGGGWAGVLQSAMANSALEAAQAVGVPVDDAVLERSREYQKSNVDSKTGEVRTESAAGVSLYSITSNQRATAPEARDAERRIEEAKRQGLLKSDAPVTKGNLMGAGMSDKDADRLAKAHEQNKTAQRMLSDESVMAGFGNNGGEEFLSYMMTSESMVITGDSEYNAWYQNMSRRLEKIQDANGNWAGHHCITSPVFCTAAVIMTLTADRDVDLLVKEHQKQGK